MTTKRVYHPETNEPFDVPVNRANSLILNHGWTQTPSKPAPAPEPTPVPYITTVEIPESDSVPLVTEDVTVRWPGTTGRRGRKVVAPDNAE